MQLAAAILSLLLLVGPGKDFPAPNTPSPGLHYYYLIPPQEPKHHELDICVYGGTPAGVMAAVQARLMGKSAALVVFRRHVGGMTSGGLTATDLGNAKAIGGLAQEFFKHLGKSRGYPPSLAEHTFRKLLQDAKVHVYFEHRLAKVEKAGNRLTKLICENGSTFTAKCFIDATYEGDLLAMAGVSFTVGREPNNQYGETHNGIQFHTTHNFLVSVDPYRLKGDTSSGLLWGISNESPGNAGDGDKKLQAYNFRWWLSNAPDRIAFPKPANYDRNRYLLLVRYIRAVGNDEKFQFNAPYGPFQLFNGDCNNDGGLSTDYIGGNQNWPLADYHTREKIFQDHVNYQQGLAWFVGHDPDIPEKIRAKLLQFGLAAKEFPETGGWPHELYVREGRRMISDYVMTDRNCLSQITISDSIGLASYNMDSHNCRRIIINGKVRNEGDVQIKLPKPYPMSFRSIVPKESECSNLLVPVCLSASHIAYGSIRMEPIFMILGQSAATAASLAIDNNTQVQQVDYPKLRTRLLADGQLLDWR